MPPHLGQGPERFPVIVMFKQFSTNMPDGNGVLQLSQNAGIIGIIESPLKINITPA
ncbi:hypothetical protein VCSRO19_3552 [Vibrio cholerae]|nr:hypothetical protein VCSRO19_3552 [Vibrio cholerae]